MVWTYALKHKVTASVVLFLAIVLVLLNNFSGRKQTGRMKEAIGSIYKDRMLAESYIFQYAEHLQSITAVSGSDQLSAEQKQVAISQSLREVAILNTAYQQTYLTTEEQVQYDKLQRHFTAIRDESVRSSFSGVGAEAVAAKQNLHILSAIQVAEAEHLMGEVDKAYSSITNGTTFEIALLIVIGLVIQGLVYASRTISSTVAQQRPHLN